MTYGCLGQTIGRGGRRVLLVLQPGLSRYGLHPKGAGHADDCGRRELGTRVGGGGAADCASLLGAGCGVRGDDPRGSGNFGARHPVRCRANADSLTPNACPVGIRAAPAIRAASISDLREVEADRTAGAAMR